MAKPHSDLWKLILLFCPGSILFYFCDCPYDESKEKKEEKVHETAREVKGTHRPNALYLGFLISG